MWTKRNSGVTSNWSLRGLKSLALAASAPSGRAVLADPYVARKLACGNRAFERVCQHVAIGWQGAAEADAAARDLALEIALIGPTHVSAGEMVTIPGE